MSSLPEKSVKFGVFVAARIGSSRLPGKALLPLLGMPMVAFLLRRLQGSRSAGRLILATTDLPEDDRLEAIARAEGVSVFRGDKSDLVKRFVEAARAYPCDFVVRVTADCPFVDATLLDHCLSQCEAPGAFDLASTKTRFPVGLDFEIYSSAVMESLHQSQSLDADEREHLTLHMYRHPDRFVLRPLHPPPGWKESARSFTVDTAEDYRFASDLSERMGDWKAGVMDFLSEARAP